MNNYSVGRVAHTCLTVSLPVTQLYIYNISTGKDAYKKTINLGQNPT